MPQTHVPISSIQAPVCRITRRRRGYLSKAQRETIAKATTNNTAICLTASAPPTQIAATIIQDRP